MITTIEEAGLAKKHAADKQTETINAAFDEASRAVEAPAKEATHSVTETSSSMGTGGLYHDHAGVVHKHPDSYVSGVGSPRYKPQTMLQSLWSTLSGKEI